jgi:arylsulfatase A-like enzyme
MANCVPKDHFPLTNRYTISTAAKWNLSYNPLSPTTLMSARSPESHQDPMTVRPATTYATKLMFALLLFCGDLYPTLIDLCGLPQRDGLDGRSIAPLVRDSTIQWPYPAIITHSPHWHGMNHAIRSQRYHYIGYGDGGEELYDMQEDPNQWRNLADSPTHRGVKKELQDWMPKTNAAHFQGEPR